MTPTPYLRELPHDLQAEQAVIGSMLCGGPASVEEAQSGLPEQAFYAPAHRLIFSAIISGHAGGKIIDLVTLTDGLNSMGMLEQVGGGAALTQMFTLVPSGAALPFYLDIVREKFLLREMIRGAAEVTETAYQPHGDLQEKIDAAQKFFTDLALSLSKRGQQMRPTSETIPEAREEIIAIHEGRGHGPGLDTGIFGLDRMTGGLRKGQVVVLAARTSNGKSALALNIAEYVAVNEKTPVAVFTLEMSVAEINQRLLLSRAKVDLGVLRNGFMAENSMERIDQAAEVLTAAKIYIDDTSDLRLFEFIARARRARVAHKVGLIIVDYVQLMHSGTKRGLENRVLEISEITGGIKKTARELEIPIIVVAQLNRRADDRPGGVPRLADLRESGSIEQDADIVLFIHRPEMYATDETREALEGTANLIVAKQRSGPTTDGKGLPLVFLKQFTRFENPAMEKFYSNNPAHRQRNGTASD